jgi:hypothetical protein
MQGRREGEAGELPRAPTLIGPQLESIFEIEGPLQ